MTEKWLTQKAMAKARGQRQRHGALAETDGTERGQWLRQTGNGRDKAGCDGRDKWEAETRGAMAQTRGIGRGRWH